MKLNMFNLTFNQPSLSVKCALYLKRKEIKNFQMVSKIIFNNLNTNAFYRRIWVLYGRVQYSLKVDFKKKMLLEHIKRKINDRVFYISKGLKYIPDEDLHSVGITNPKRFRWSWHITELPRILITLDDMNKDIDKFLNKKKMIHLEICRELGTTSSRRLEWTATKNGDKVVDFGPNLKFLKETSEYKILNELYSKKESYVGLTLTSLPKKFKDVSDFILKMIQKIYSHTKEEITSQINRNQKNIKIYMDNKKYHNERLKIKENFDQKLQLSNKNFNNTEQSLQHQRDIYWNFIHISNIKDRLNRLELDIIDKKLSIISLEKKLDTIADGAASFLNLNQYQYCLVPYIHNIKNQKKNRQKLGKTKQKHLNYLEQLQKKINLLHL